MSTTKVANCVMIFRVTVAHMKNLVLLWLPPKYFFILYWVTINGKKLFIQPIQKCQGYSNIARGCMVVTSLLYHYAIVIDDYYTMIRQSCDNYTIWLQGWYNLGTTLWYSYDKVSCTMHMTLGLKQDFCKVATILTSFCMGILMIWRPSHIL